MVYSKCLCISPKIINGPPHEMGRLQNYLTSFGSAPGFGE